MANRRNKVETQLTMLCFSPIRLWHGAVCLIALDTHRFMTCACQQSPVSEFVISQPIIFI